MVANFQALDVFILNEVNQMGGAAEPGKRAMPASITFTTPLMLVLLAAWARIAIVSVADIRSTCVAAPVMI